VLRSIMVATLTSFTMLTSLSVSHAKEDPPTLPHRDPAGRHGPSVGVDAPKELLHTLDPIDVPIFKDGRHQGYLGITVTVQAFDNKGIEQIKALEPRLRDMIITDMHSALYLLWEPNDLPSKKVVTKRLLTSAKKIAPDLIDKMYTRDFYVKRQSGR